MIAYIQVNLENLEKRNKKEDVKAYKAERFSKVALLVTLHYITNGVFIPLYTGQGAVSFFDTANSFNCCCSRS